ncbi:hypothetical protein C8J57DRAFT_1434769 [Mycena rebaudengoi]|nr:hypothetical protein C8J57DRAFT_1434769 [Mycena rebaudengoi]
MLSFVRNRATNLLPLLLGLFFKISGTSIRVLRTLSNTGVCVSSRTVERLKARISDDAIQLGIALIRSGTMFCTLFDNINIFLRKSQQRITNRNSMIHATNDDSHMELSFQALVAEIIILFCPDNVDVMMPKDRPMEVHKTDARPFGVFDVNEEGIIDLFDGIRERSTLTKTQWAAKTRIVQGDWLSTNNYRNARRIRRDDVDTFERMDYGEDLTALFHHALQASHSIMRVHYGHAVRDPMSLAAHKGLLHRTWDVKKPNYAASKSLIRHSLIACILHCVMYAPYEQAKAAHDDYLAHSIYFNRDALLFCKFENSVSLGDAGGVMRVLKYWALAFRGAGQHNYARECVEVLIRTKYELPESLRLAREKVWFINRWGKYKRCIAADLWLEQQNFWVKVC